MPSDGYHVIEAERMGIIDLHSGVVSPPGTDKQLALDEAFSLGVLNPRSISIRSSSGRHLNATEALEQGVLDKSGRINHDGRHLTLSEAIDKQVTTYILIVLKPFDFLGCPSWARSTGSD